MHVAFVWSDVLILKTEPQYVLGDYELLTVSLLIDPVFPEGGFIFGSRKDLGGGGVLFCATMKIGYTW